VIRLGTRASALALVQAREVADRLTAGGAEVEIVSIRTEGDRQAEARLAVVGGKGLFVREIEEALLRKEIDLAVHSLKDLPAEQPDGLTLSVYPPRADARDVLVARGPATVATLPAAAVVGTSSPRRRAMVLSLRPDLDVQPIRGNVDTRLRKLDAGGFDAIVLAAAGLDRLGLSLPHCEFLDPDVFVPAVGQGILALEARIDDRTTLDHLTALDDPATRACALAERAYLARLGASCNTPMAAHARLQLGSVRLTGIVASEDGRRLLRASATGLAAEALELGRGLAEALLAQGAAAITPLEPKVSPSRRTS
jgi:hydroxymethylbilane synthase